MDIKAASKLYNDRKEDLDQVVIEALLELYKELTHKEPSDSFVDKISDAVNYE